jgi:hypothetical protein
MTQQYGIGSDTTLTILINGQLFVHQIINDFEAKQLTTRLKSVGMDGVNRYRELEEGWDGTFSFDRGDSALDDFFAAKEAGRYAGQAPPVITITETTIGAETRVPAKYRYDGVTLKFDTIGSRSGDKKIDEKVGWAASRRFKIQ